MVSRFALLEHIWDGIHFDLMIERDGVLKTWSVDSAIVAGEEIPARLRADHRLLYLDFEGTISGNRGSVRRLARGSYRVMNWSTLLIERRVALT